MATSTDLTRRQHALNLHAARAFVPPVQFCMAMCNWLTQSAKPIPVFGRGYGEKGGRLVPKCSGRLVASKTCLSNIEVADPALALFKLAMVIC
jgi:hypothetical protein